MSICEMAVSVVCGCLLLSILLPAALMAEHWMEDAGHRVVDRMVWQEPVERWNQSKSNPLELHRFSRIRFEFRRVGICKALRTKFRIGFAEWG